MYRSHRRGLKGLGGDPPSLLFEPHVGHCTRYRKTRNNLCFEVAAKEFYEMIEPTNQVMQMLLQSMQQYATQIQLI